MILAGAAGGDPDVDLSDEVEWRTGTWVDAFNGVYRLLARVTRDRIGFSPDQIDRMLVSTVAVLLGVGVDPGAKDVAELAALAARRAAGEDVGWDDDVPVRRRGLDDRVVREGSPETWHTVTANTPPLPTT